MLRKIIVLGIILAKCFQFSDKGVIFACDKNNKDDEDSIRNKQ